MLVTRVGLPPFIVTLGTLNIAFALTHIYSNDETISDLPSLFTALGNSFKIGSTSITYGSLLCLGLFVRRLVRAVADDLGPARLRARRRPRGHAPDGHQRQAPAD